MTPLEFRALWSSFVKIACLNPALLLDDVCLPQCLWCCCLSGPRKEGRKREQFHLAFFQREELALRVKHRKQQQGERKLERESQIVRLCTLASDDEELGPKNTRTSQFTREEEKKKKKKKKAASSAANERAETYCRVHHKHLELKLVLLVDR